ncbi:MAG: hypothetical protein KAR38_02635, partial [Calditrichia bacterium]|nr:hypothetical protein [Calditrichia bacterium]
GNYQTTMSSIWGSSADNIYVVGEGSAKAKMFHYNGSNWNVFNNEALAGIHLRYITGFSENDIWITGERYDRMSSIIHYDGNSWHKVDHPMKYGGLNSMSGDYSGYLWAGGAFGALFRYDGVSWQPDSIEYETEWDYHIFDIAGNGVYGYYLITMTNLEDENGSGYNFSHLFNYMNDKWTKIDSSLSWDYTKLWMSPSGNLYVAGSDLYILEGNSLKSIEDKGIFISIYGLSDNDIFLTKSYYAEGYVYHYNGHDFYEFKELYNPNVFYSDVWTDGKEVFVVGDFVDKDGITKTLIAHGK